MPLVFGTHTSLQAIASGGTKLYSSSDNPYLITDVLCTSNKLSNENPVL